MTYNNNDPLVHFWQATDSGKFVVHFYNTGNDHNTFYPNKLENSIYLDWHKESFIFFAWNNSFRLKKLIKLQIIQSTSDGRNCNQQMLINGISIWSRNLSCAPILTETQNIYFTGLQGNAPDVEVRNFQFFTHPV